MRAFFTTTVRRADDIFRSGFTNLYEFGGINGVCFTDRQLDARDGFVGEPSGEIAIASCVEALSRVFPAPHLGEQRREPRVHLMVFGFVLKDRPIAGDGLPHPAPAPCLIGGGERGHSVVGLPPEHRG